MRGIVRRTALGTACVVLVLAAMAAGAGATMTSQSYEPAGTIREASIGLVTLSGGLTSIRCRLTLNGSIAEGPIAARNGAAIGSVTGASIQAETCVGGVITAINRTTTLMRGVLEGGRIHLMEDGTPEGVEDLELANLEVVIEATEFGAECAWSGILVVLEEATRIGETTEYELGNVTIPSGGATSTFTRIGGLCAERVTLSGVLAGPSPAQTLTLR